MGGKKDKSEGLGRALVRQHNQMVRESKEKGRALRLQNRRVLESVTDVSDIDAVLEKAEEADRIYSLDKPAPNLLINLLGNEQNDSRGEEAATETRGGLACQQSSGSPQASVECYNVGGRA